MVTNLHRWTITQTARSHGNIIVDEKDLTNLTVEQQILDDQRRGDIKHAKEALEKTSGLPMYDSLPTYAEDVIVAERGDNRPSKLGNSTG